MMTDGQTEFPLVDSTPVRGGVKIARIAKKILCLPSLIAYKLKVVSSFDRRFKIWFKSNLVF